MRPGRPGTGKTAVGLHRAAYLLFTHREKLARSGVMIVGPNRAFLSYISSVLPALGEIKVDQTTVAGILGDHSAPEDPAVSALKGDAKIVPVLERALWAHIVKPAEGLLVTKGSNRYRVADYEVREIVASLRGTTRYGPGRAALAQRLAHQVLVRMEQRGESPDDRVQDAVARSKPVKQLVDQVWPKLTPAQVLYRLFSDAEFLAAAAKNDLTADEQTALLWARPAKSFRSAKWSAADCALMDELADMIERTPSLGHLVVDEAQDLSSMQLRALGRRCRTGSATVLGDIAQGTTPGRRGPGPRSSGTWASPTARSPSWCSASACPARSSTTPPGCSPPSPPAWPRPARSVPVRARCPYGARPTWPRPWPRPPGGRWPGRDRSASSSRTPRSRPSPGCCPTSATACWPPTPPRTTGS
nr:hypothetical protein GCM10020093_066680 [Planobispora longispora]